MKAAIINSHSMQKSTGKLAYSLFKHLEKNGSEVRLFYGKRIPGDVPNEKVVCTCTKSERIINAICDRVLGNEGLNAHFSTIRLIRMLKEYNPDVIYLMNLHAYYINQPMLFRYICSRNIKVIYVMFDEYAMTGKCCFAYDCEKYKSVCGSCPQISAYPKSIILDKSRKLQEMKKQNYLLINDITFVGVSHTISRAKMSSILPEYAKYVIADEGIDVDNIFYYRNTDLLKTKLGINEKQVVILTVAPFSDFRKGGKYYLELAKRFENNSKYLFIHVGYDGSTSNLPKNFIPVSYVSDQIELAEYYSLADIFVCTSFAETIPDTCIEALACGTPVLGFDISGIPTCADKKHGTFVEAGNVDALSGVISNTKKKTMDIIKSCRAYAVDRFDIKKYVKTLEQVAIKETCKG